MFFAKMGGSIRLAVTGVIFAIGLTGCGMVNNADPESADRLAGRVFQSTAVMEAGEPRPLVDQPLEVTFREPLDEHLNEVQNSDAVLLVAWTSGCNTYNVLFVVSEDQLREQEAPYGEMDATAMGCEPAMTEEEGWLSEFFNDNPNWELDENELIMSTRNIEIEFEASGSVE
jgi:heat shock protein HslJ